MLLDVNSILILLGLGLFAGVVNTLAGGGDTLSAIKNTNTHEGFNYISNAGGAFLEWLEGNESPGVIALKRNNLI